MDTSNDLVKGLIGLLVALVTGLAGLLGWRGISGVKHANAGDARQSRFEENLQKRHDALLARNSELQEELRQARDGRALLERKTRDQAKKLENLLEMLGESERKSAERWIRESAFAPFDDKPQGKR